MIFLNKRTSQYIKVQFTKQTRFRLYLQVGSLVNKHTHTIIKYHVERDIMNFKLNLLKLENFSFAKSRFSARETDYDTRIAKRRAMISVPHEESRLPRRKSKRLGETYIS